MFFIYLMARYSVRYQRAINIISAWCCKMVKFGPFSLRIARTPFSTGTGCTKDVCFPFRKPFCTSYFRLGPFVREYGGWNDAAPSQEGSSCRLLPLSPVRKRDERLTERPNWSEDVEVSRNRLDKSQRPVQTKDSSPCQSGIVLVSEIAREATGTHCRFHPRLDLFR